MADLSCTVDPGGGGDYSTLSAAEAANQQDLTDGGGDTFTFNCSSSDGSDDNTYAVISGWTTGSSNWIKILGTDFPSDGIWDDSAYVISTSATYDIAIYEQYVYIVNIQCSPSASNGFYPTVANCFIDSCLLNGKNNGVILINAQSGATTYVYNCTIEDCTTGIKDYGTSYIYNCTIYDCTGQGLYNVSNSMTARNTAIGACGDDILNAGSLDIDYMVTDDDHSGDCANYHAYPTAGSGDWSSDFNDPANGDFTILSTASNLRGNGVDDPSSGLYSDDIIDFSRTSTWDIGAYEYDDGGAPPSNAPTGNLSGSLVGCLGGVI